MTSPELERLAQIGTLKREPGAQAEIAGLIRSARSRLTDARRPDLALESRFDLAYNAAHALALAALRWWGYRSDNRYIAFQALLGGCWPPVISVAMRLSTRVTWKWMSAS